jgi:hypothetical protein
MGPFSKEKKLVDYDLKELDLEMLSQLQASLVAKLILVNEELSSRWKNISALGSDLPNSDDARAVLDSGTEHLEEFNSILQSELARITGNAG